MGNVAESSQDYSLLKKSELKHLNFQRTSRMPKDGRAHAVN